MREAAYYDKMPGQSVKCRLCPHYCLIGEGDYGKCMVRVNQKGTLYASSYGHPVSVTPDPVEKKPLYHYFPGRVILSVGTRGCNFRCSFCQNHDISQPEPGSHSGTGFISPDEIVRQAAGCHDNIGIAFTYNEPVVFFEYMRDIAKKARENNLKSVVVSNGYINEGPLRELLGVADAFNIDLKSFSNTFYRDVAGGSLGPVLRTLRLIRESALHLEITHLVVTGLNDDEEEFKRMVEWIASELGETTILHISRYFPSWKLDNPPTPSGVINRFARIASERLAFVYTGNMPAGSDGTNTICPTCRNEVISRSGYQTGSMGLDPKGNCRHCDTSIAIRS